jgi:hypothetical protein
MIHQLPLMGLDFWGKAGRPVLSLADRSSRRAVTASEISRGDGEIVAALILLLSLLAGKKTLERLTIKHIESSVVLK